MQIMFTKYIKLHPPVSSECYELKICKGISLPFNAVKEHQVANLVDCETDSGLFYKIQDMHAANGFADPKPFDCFYTCNTKAFIVIWFYKPRQPKIFYKIPIFEWIGASKGATRKSITEDMVKLIASEEIVIKSKDY